MAAKAHNRGAPEHPTGTCEKHQYGARGTKYEVSTNTRDPSLQLVFADPWGTLTQLGLSIPAAIPTFYPQNFANRYLALLSSRRFAAGEKFRLVGMRQRVLIGQLVGITEVSTGYPVYTAVTTPEWHFSDANISWHLRRVPLQQVFNQNQFNAAELAFRTTDTPAILYENAPAQLGGYAPPNGGVPPGDAFIPEFGDFHDMRFPWQDDIAWSALNIEGEGPCAIQFFASIQQTDPSERPTLNLSGLSADAINSLVPEERFIQNFPNAIYTRIAGSLIFEEANFHEEPYPLVEPTPSKSIYVPKRFRGRNERLQQHARQPAEHQLAASQARAADIRDHSPCWRRRLHRSRSRASVGAHRSAKRHRRYGCGGRLHGSGGGCHPDPSDSARTYTADHCTKRS